MPIDKVTHPGQPPNRDPSSELTLGRFKLNVVFRSVGNARGVTIHIFGPVGNVEEEVLRFDCFDEQPHYHLGWSYRDEPFIPIEANDPLNWTLDKLSNSLPDLLEHAQAHPLDTAELKQLPGVLDQLREAAAKLRASAP